MSENKGYSKIALVLILAILSAVSGAIGGAFYQSSLQPSTSTITPNVIPTGLWLVTMNDSTANRAVNTLYLNSNSGGNAMIVRTFWTLTTGGAASAKSNVTVYVTSGVYPVPASTNSGSIQLTKGLNMTVVLSFYVPFGFHYEVNSTVSGSGSVVTLYKWFETIPPTGFGAIIQPLLQSLLRRQQL